MDTCLFHTLPRALCKVFMIISLTCLSEFVPSHETLRFQLFLGSLPYGFGNVQHAERPRFGRFGQQCPKKGKILFRCNLWNRNLFDRFRYASFTFLGCTPKLFFDKVFAEVFAIIYFRSSSFSSSARVEILARHFCTFLHNSRFG